MGKRKNAINITPEELSDKIKTIGYRLIAREISASPRGVYSMAKRLGIKSPRKIGRPKGFKVKNEKR